MRHWYALRTKPRQEVVAATHLEKASIPVYLPQLREVVQSGRPPVMVPFFPNYMFGQLDPELGELRLVRYTRGITEILGYGGEPHPVPDELIPLIRERLGRERGNPGLANLRPGDPVVITKGPLKDVEAIFDEHLAATGRVRVLVRLLHRLCRADVHARQVQPVRKAAKAA